MRVLLAGGGSGGSATPVLAVAEILRERVPDAEFLFVGTAAGPERALVQDAGFPFASVPAGRLRRYLTVQNVLDVGAVFAGYLRSLSLVSRFQPTIAFGAGGFASVPPLWAAARWRAAFWRWRTPVYIHQQDVTPGLANRLLAPFATIISVSFPETLQRFPTAKTQLRGNPVRRSVLAGSRERAISAFGLEDSLPTVLATGGGTGALRLNHLIAMAAPRLVERCQILHLTGLGRGVPSRTTSPRYQQREFLTREMKDALAAADIVVSRAGMGTLTEISALGKASVIVPMPGSHQLANAEVYSRGNAAVVCDQERTSPDDLAREINSLLSNEERRRSLGEAARALMPLGAAELIAEDLIALGP